MARLPASRRRLGLPLVLLGALGMLLDWRTLSASSSFVPGAPRRAGARRCGAGPGSRGPARRLALAQGTAPGASKDAQGAAAAAKLPGEQGKSQQEIDDAVLRMAMAMAEEEGNANGASEKAAEQKEEGFEFDFQLLITVGLVGLIIYSFGSAFIGITTGRVQDRSGGDFTAYDFFDNIIAFKEWNLEYTLGFDPFKLFSKS
mmetsp:Transcript_94438/g.281891  ORF Transcript_94438/g.281891 Transcript_94438/m.281891 type:complete len:202 (-) Transcript_94438:180-785(-)|eukprot:CAMPEP_0175215746 /NCGR_PEP_ID=MMETSP0093-20121207/17372_1 /TAXON_ID=311494 /ORGANISM="Alexandrium monilatum, Strain CCMP3105" /LENGTH=201 /DNA_ID=CAMNT_0016509121 /DNA_START=47 /DNA_END=652 /DNA_ORIENTATION=+